MENKNCISGVEVKLFFCFLADHDALSSYLDWCAKLSPNFYLLFSRYNYEIPAEYFISAAFVYRATSEPKRWANLDKKWRHLLKTYRLTVK